MTRGHSVFTPKFSSHLAPVFARYVDLKQALGRRFDAPARTLQCLDRFLCDQESSIADLNATAFQAWCHTHEHVTSGVRRVRMLEVCAFCLYRRRTEPQCFVPDPTSFPPYHQRLKPYIFSEAEVARLLRAASGLRRSPLSPLRPEAIRLAIMLLFTTGIRRGELLNLTIGDYDRRESTLHIRQTKFYKFRLLPINSGIADEIDHYLRTRSQRKLSVSTDTALIWNSSRGGGAYSGTSLRRSLKPLLQKCRIIAWLEQNGLGTLLPPRGGMRLGGLLIEDYVDFGRFLEAYKERTAENRTARSIPSFVYLLLHTMAHHFAQAVVEYSGLEYGSLGEYLFPADLAFIAYRRGMTPDLANLSAMWRNQGVTVLEHLLWDRALKCDAGSLCDQRGGACPACIMAPEVTCLAGNNLLSRTALNGGPPPSWDSNRSPLTGFLRMPA